MQHLVSLEVISADFISHQGIQKLITAVWGRYGENSGYFCVRKNRRPDKANARAVYPRDAGDDLHPPQNNSSIPAERNFI
jgi:hypothetical protein